MRAVDLFFRLTVYYICVTGTILTLAFWLPDLAEYMPVGGAESLIAGAADDPFSTIEIGADRVGNLVDSIIWLVIALIGAFLTVLPVSWTYMAIRKRDEYDQSLVETIIILPIAVTAIVIIVHNSLALAFSLAGIVGGVRFRNTLKSSGDALYILLAIGIGLSAGIGAMEIAIVMSMAFNYCFLGLWATEYGMKPGTRKYMRRNHKKVTDEDRV
ncbi:MAG: DUF4956 domain-containing protein [Pacificimonas sp.]